MTWQDRVRAIRKSVTYVGPYELATAIKNGRLYAITANTDVVELAYNRGIDEPISHSYYSILNVIRRFDKANNAVLA